jgi:hypothetical protein
MLSLQLVAGSTGVITASFDSTYGNNLPLKKWEYVEVVDAPYEGS